MDRRSIMKHAGLAGVLAAGIAPAAHAQTAVRWRMASSFPKSLDTIFGSGEMFAKTVKALSGGKFEVSVHAGGELMPAFAWSMRCKTALWRWRRRRRITSLAKTQFLPLAARCRLA